MLTKITAYEISFRSQHAEINGRGYIVEQRKSVIHISKPDGGTRINISNPFLFKVTHENVR